MKQIVKIGLAYLLVFSFITGISVTVAQQLDTGIISQTSLYAEAEKKPSDPGAKPAEEDEGGCKC